MAAPNLSPSNGAFTNITNLLNSLYPAPSAPSAAPQAAPVASAAPAAPVGPNAPGNVAAPQLGGGLFNNVTRLFSGVAPNTGGSGVQLPAAAAPVAAGPAASASPAAQPPTAPITQLAQAAQPAMEFPDIWQSVLSSLMAKGEGPLSALSMLPQLGVGS